MSPRRMHQIRQGERPWLETLGKQIAEARLAAGLSQQDLADEMGISRSMIAMIEVGRTGLSAYLLMRLSEVLELEALPVTASDAQAPLLRKLAEQADTIQDLRRRVMAARNALLGVSEGDQGEPRTGA